MLINKTLEFSAVDLKFDGDGGKFEGYASVFGGVDSYGDTIAKGAFSDTLKNFGMPKMFFNHEWSLPIGKWLSASEDDKGLRVVGEFTPGIALSSDVRSAMKHGTLDGLSVGGMVAKGDFTDDGDVRTIHRWTRLYEVSPVAFPADDAARVDDVKSQLIGAIESVESVRDIERLLRDAGGFSKSAAAALIARAKLVFGVAGDPNEEASAEMKSIGERIARIAAITNNCGARYER